MAEEKEKAVVPAPRVLAELFGTNGTIRIELLPTINREGEGGTSGGENEGLQDLKSRMASIESSLADVKKADSGELEKRLGTLEDAVNKSNEQGATLKDKVSQIDTLKTEISQIDGHVSERINKFEMDFDTLHGERVHELETRVQSAESGTTDLYREIESLKARLEALEQK